MTLSIRQYKNNDELIKELESRNLIFVDQDAKNKFKEYLKCYGYFSFIKQYSNPLMYEDVENKVYKKEFTSNNLRYLFDIDRNNSVVIFKYFRSIEFLLNSSILKVVAKKVDKLAQCPYLAAISAEDFNELFPNLDQKIPSFKKFTKNNYENFYEDLFKNFNNRNFDSKDIIRKNKIEENDKVQSLINEGWFKKTINDYSKKHKIKIINDWEYLDIFSLFQILSFSQLIRIFSYLSQTLQNEVIKEFCNNFQPFKKHDKLKSETFKVLIQIFASLRNILMHNGCLVKFKHIIYENESEKIINNLSSYFNLNLDANSNIRLKEVIEIMELIIGIKGVMFNEINNMFTIKFAKISPAKKEEFSQLVLDIIENESGIKIEKLD